MPHEAHTQTIVMNGPLNLFPLMGVAAVLVEVEGLAANRKIGLGFGV